MTEESGACRGASPSASVPGASGQGAAALYRLMSWLSPAYPVGAYTYSHGLEWAVEAGDVRDAASAGEWIAGLLHAGGGLTDAIFLVHAARAQDATAVRELAELALALSPSVERRLETTAQGRAFLDVTARAWPGASLALLGEVEPREVPYPVVVGVVMAANDVDLASGTLAYLHGFVSNLVSAAVRLVPLGQTQGQQLIAGFEGAVQAVATRALSSTLDDLATCTLRADIASMRHETQYTRLFRS